MWHSPNSGLSISLSRSQWRPVFVSLNTRTYCTVNLYSCRMYEHSIQRSSWNPCSSWSEAEKKHWRRPGSRWGTRCRRCGCSCRCPKVPALPEDCARAPQRRAAFLPRAEQRSPDAPGPSGAACARLRSRRRQSAKRDLTSSERRGAYARAFLLVEEATRQLRYLLHSILYSYQWSLITIIQNPVQTDSAQLLRITFVLLIDFLCQHWLLEITMASWIY